MQAYALNLEEELQSLKTNADAQAQALALAQTPTANGRSASKENIVPWILVMLDASNSPFSDGLIQQVSPCRSTSAFVLGLSWRDGIGRESREDYRPPVRSSGKRKRTFGESNCVRFEIIDQGRPKTREVPATSFSSSILPPRSPRSFVWLSSTWIYLS